MASFLKSLSPVPYFPPYTGPYAVGSTDVEIPITELNSSSPDDSICTIQFRIFYPCDADAKSARGVRWLPKPQHGYTAAYSRFLGAGTALAGLIAYFGSLLYFIEIPVLKNAPPLPATTASKRWPVMVFSHGLGGTRNAYSALVGTIASHGVVVVCPEHRDGSSPISYIRDVTESTSPNENRTIKTSKRSIDYLHIPHKPSPEVENARTKQLRTRLWELGLLHDALVKVDKGSRLRNLNRSSGPSLIAFQDTLDVHKPGSITFAGHSFGAATTVQFVKSVFYAPEISSAPSDYAPLYSPDSSSAISNQITSNTPVVLLDVWCLPLKAESAAWLWNKPLPCYAPGGPGGSALLAVESQSFFVWKEHLRITKQLLSPNPSTEEYKYDDKTPEPHFYYPSKSAHLSQSDFGILFPWLTKKIFTIEDPERIMRLNTRAILQLMRETGIEVAKTSAKDMEMEEGSHEATGDDKLIFARNGARNWNFLTTNLAEDMHEKDDSMVGGKAEPSEAVMEGEVMTGNKVVEVKA